jgi:hypothetical protein
MIHNFPDKSVRMSVGVLALGKFDSKGGAINSPSGVLIEQLPVKDGMMSIDFSKASDRIKTSVFGEVGDKDEQKYTLRELNRQGIVCNADTFREWKMDLPVLNLIDAVFANVLQRICSGEHEYISIGAERLLDGPQNIWKEIAVPPKSSVLSVVDELREHAERHSRDGKSYMRISTKMSPGLNGGSASYHAENIDVNRFLKFDPDKMSPGSYYAIGNSNWMDKFGNHIGLAIHKTKASGENGKSGAPIYKFVRAVVSTNGTKLYKESPIEIIIVRG